MSVTLITGGIRSGKSDHALEVALSYPKPRFFIATAVAFDSEMEARIKNHKKHRGNNFCLIEEPVKLAKALINIEKGGNVCVVDCLNVWLNNLLYYDRLNEIDNFLDVVIRLSFDLVLVTNEIGMGIVPDNELSRRFVELLGKLNRDMARISDKVVLMVSGIPVKIKG